MTRGGRKKVLRKRVRKLGGGRARQPKAEKLISSGADVGRSLKKAGGASDSGQNQLAISIKFPQCKSEFKSASTSNQESKG